MAFLVSFSLAGETPASTPAATDTADSIPPLFVISGIKNFNQESRNSGSPSRTILDSWFPDSDFITSKIVIRDFPHLSPLPEGEAGAFYAHRFLISCFPDSSHQTSKIRVVVVSDIKDFPHLSPLPQGEAAGGAHRFLISCFP